MSQNSSACSRSTDLAGKASSEKSCRGSAAGLDIVTVRFRRRFGSEWPSPAVGVVVMILRVVATAVETMEVMMAVLDWRPFDTTFPFYFHFLSFSHANKTHLVQTFDIDRKTFWCVSVYFYFYFFRMFWTHLETWNGHFVKTHCFCSPLLGMFSIVSINNNETFLLIGKFGWSCEDSFEPLCSRSGYHVPSENISGEGEIGNVDSVYFSLPLLTFGLVARRRPGFPLCNRLSLKMISTVEVWSYFAVSLLHDYSDRNAYCAVAAMQYNLKLQYAVELWGYSCFFFFF